jgi:hypothetical protein
MDTPGETTLDQVRRDTLNDAFRAVLNDAAGKRVLYWMLEQAALYEAAYTGEAASTNFLLGRQEVGRRIIGQLDEIDARFYPQLLIDIASIREADSARANSLSADTDEDDDNAP